jgi:hypothetical protein
MVYVVVPLLLKWNIGVLFGALRRPRSDAPPPPFFFACYVSVSLCCSVASVMLCFEEHNLVSFER